MEQKTRYNYPVSTNGRQVSLPSTHRNNLWTHRGEDRVHYKEHCPSGTWLCAISFLPWSVCYVSSSLSSAIVSHTSTFTQSLSSPLKYFIQGCPRRNREIVSVSPLEHCLWNLHAVCALDTSMYRDCTNNDKCRGYQNCETGTPGYHRCFAEVPSSFIYILRTLIKRLC